MEQDPFAPSAAGPARDPHLGTTNDGWLTIAFALLIVPAGLCAMGMLVGLTP